MRIFFRGPVFFFARNFPRAHHGRVKADPESPELAVLLDLEATCFAHPWTAGQIEAELNRADSIRIFLDADGNVQEFSKLAGSGPPDAAGRGTAAPALIGNGPAIIAFCLVRAPSSDGGEPAEILRIAVRPEARQKGLAGRLLSLAEQEARARAPGTRFLLEVAESNAAARALYARAGYREIHRRRNYYRDGTDALILEKMN